MLTPISEEGNDQNDEEREGEVVGVAAGGVVGGDEVLSNLSFISTCILDCRSRRPATTTSCWRWRRSCWWRRRGEKPMEVNFLWEKNLSGENARWC